LPKESISGVFRAALNIKVLTPFLLLGLYELIMVYLLYRTGFWASDLVKETIFWFVFSGIPTLSMTATQEEDINWRAILRRHLGLLFFLEFIISEFTFGFLIELFLVPFLAVMGAGSVVAERNEDFEEVARFLGILQATISFGILVYAGGSAIGYWRNTGAFFPMRVFLLPVVLTGVSIPFFYGLRLYVFIEKTFVLLRLGHSISKDTKCYAKWQIVRLIRFNIRRASRFFEEFRRCLPAARDKEDIDHIILEWRHRVRDNHR